jgi:hypothetical protein
MLLAPVHAQRLPVRESGAGIRKILIAGALTVVLATGCGSASHPRSAGKFPIVVAHPTVQTSGLPNVKLSGDEAMLLAPAQVVFITTGSISCVWWPARLTVLGPSTIRIDMRVNGRVATCPAGAAAFPIAVKIDPKIVDVHHPLTVRLAYKVRLPGSGRTRQWQRIAVAPALSRS